MLKTGEVETITKRYISQEGLSRLLQRSLERNLAGLALVHPVEVLAIYDQLRPIMLDDIAPGFLQLLDDHKDQLQELDNDARLELCDQLATDFEGGKHKTELLGWMNDTSTHFDPAFINTDGSIAWIGYSVTGIINQLLGRIKDQAFCRAGLPDICQFALEVLSG